VIGRRDRIPADLCDAIMGSEGGTAAGTGLHLRFAVDYSAREAALLAAHEAWRGSSTPLPVGPDAALARLMDEAARSFGAPEVDLLIRTGGEMRLSDCILWESPYAELVFTDRLWPDFDSSDLTLAMLEFHSRRRRFGGVQGAA
jgi:undecaprenyl diphosphate synthase